MTGANKTFRSRELVSHLGGESISQKEGGRWEQIHKERVAVLNAIRT